MIWCKFCFGHLFLTVTIAKMMFYLLTTEPILNSYLLRANIFIIIFLSGSQYSKSCTKLGDQKWEGVYWVLRPAWVLWLTVKINSFIDSSYLLCLSLFLLDYCRTTTIKPLVGLIRSDSSCYELGNIPYCLRKKGSLL